MIFDLAKRFLGGIWGYVAAAGAVAVALLLALAKARQAGKDAVKAEDAKKELDDVRKAAKVDQDVATAKPDDVRDRLRQFRRD